jgi:hypothetical protein
MAYTILFAVLAYMQQYIFFLFPKIHVVVICAVW